MLLRLNLVTEVSLCSKVASIVDVLRGRVAIGETVTVRGWVRTCRDSKVGLSFLAVYDGSCFDPF